MGATLGLVAQRINADVAGLTHGAPPATTVSAEPIASVISDPMASILSGGHVLISDLAVPLGRATDAIRGPLGGLVPRRGSVTAPGPAGPVNAAAGQQAPRPTPGRSFVERVKGLLNG